MEEQMKSLEMKEKLQVQEEVVHQKVKVKHLSMSADSSHALGNIHTQYGNWEKLTSDKVIFGIIKDGVTIDFHTIPRCLRTEPPYTLPLGLKWGSHFWTKAFTVSWSYFWNYLSPRQIYI